MISDSPLQYKRFRNDFHFIADFFSLPIFFLNLERRKNITSKNGPKNQTIGPFSMAKQVWQLKSIGPLQIEGPQHLCPENEESWLHTKDVSHAIYFLLIIYDTREKQNRKAIFFQRGLVYVQW